MNNFVYVNGIKQLIRFPLITSILLDADSEDIEFKRICTGKVWITENNNDCDKTIPVWFSILNKDDNVNVVSHLDGLPSSDTTTLNKTILEMYQLLLKLNKYYWSWEDDITNGLGRLIIENYIQIHKSKVGPEYLEIRI